jgi:SAM-dependent methyltransferase
MKINNRFGNWFSFFRTFTRIFYQIIHTINSVVISCVCYLQPLKSCKKWVLLLQYSPRVYHALVRPKLITKIYIEQNIQRHFDFSNKTVLDFGSGTGANCTLFSPDHYLGIDPDQKRIDFAQRMYPSHRFQAFIGNKLPAKNCSFDVILIIAVLHHISPDAIPDYVKEFRRVLKPDGKIIIIEPCLFKKSPLCNWFMQWYDAGDYIRREEDYLNYFAKENFKCNVLKRFKKCFLYNELYFTALP